MTTQKTRLQVVLGDALLPVGELLYIKENQCDRSIFTYSREWLSMPGCFELEPSLPLNEFPHHFIGTRDNIRASLPPCVSDSLPDRWGRGVLQRFLGYPPSELDCLVNTHDTTRIGALRFLDNEGKPVAQKTGHTIPRLNSLKELQRLHRAYESKCSSDSEGSDPENFIKHIFCVSSSLGGARPKSDFDDIGVLAIAKYTSVHDVSPVVRAEVATLNIARLCGVRVATARLELMGTDHPVAIIKRFDRQEDKRIHYISAQSFLKADHRNLHYYTEIADLIRIYGVDPLNQLRELYRRALFDCLIKNKDNHLRNHGFVYTGPGNKWQLSPAFDINPDPTKGHGLQTGISNLSGAEGSTEAAIQMAPYFEIAEDEGAKIAGTMATIISSSWHHQFRQQGMTSADLKAYSPAFDHKEMQYALYRAEARITPPIMKP